VRPERTLKEFFPCFAFGLPRHEQKIAYPVARKDSAVVERTRRFNFVWRSGDPFPRKAEALANVLQVCVVGQIETDQGLADRLHAIAMDTLLELTNRATASRVDHG